MARALVSQFDVREAHGFVGTHSARYITNIHFYGHIARPRPHVARGRDPRYSRNGTSSASSRSRLRGYRECLNI